MIKTNSLEILCKELYENPPNWDEIMRRFGLSWDIGEKYYLSKLIQFFSETHLDIIVENASSKLQQLNINSELLKEKNQTDDYFFYYNKNGRLIAVHKNERARGASEYDKVILLDNSMIVYERKKIEGSYIKEIQDSIYNHFLENNGIIIPLYTDNKTFKETSKRKAEEYKIKCIIN